MVRRQTWQARRFEIFESARHFRIESNRDVRFEFESGRPIRIRIEYRSFAGPYFLTYLITMLLNATTDYAYFQSRIGLFLFWYGGRK